MDRAAALAIHESVEVPRERSAWRDLAKAQTYDASKLVAVPPWQAWSANGGHKQRLGYVGRLKISYSRRSWSRSWRWGPIFMQEPMQQKALAVFDTDSNQT